VHVTTEYTNGRTVPVRAPTATAETADTAAPDTERQPFHVRMARPALAVGAGALVALSLPPWGFWPLAIVGIALFEVALGTSPSRRIRWTLGWLFAAAWMYLGMGWMIQLTTPGYVFAGAFFAGFHALAATVAPVGRWRIIGRPIAHTLVEALRFSFPFGGVPLGSLGISQVSGPLAGVARVGGVILLTWVVFQIGFALASTPWRGTKANAESPNNASLPAVDRAGWTLPVAGLGAVLAIAAASFVAPDGTSTGDSLRIAAVQGGGDQGTSALDVKSSVVTERHLAATATIEPDPDLDLVFWPENTIDVDDYETSDIAPQVAAEAARLGVPISVGLTEDAVVDGRSGYTNAQVVVTPDGSIPARYDKVRRVPFGEYVPLRSVLETFTSAVDQVGNAVAGTEPAVLDLPTGERLATVISWEVFFGGRAREGVALDSGLILNPTNGASYTGTIVQTQQVASSRLRAIETGRWVVQAAPTGFTAFVSPSGEVVERSSQRERIVITRDVELRTGSTWYVSLGDRPFIVALLVGFAATLWLSRRERVAPTPLE
jgi:apolipoprotein N-acyltransferase